MGVKIREIIPPEAIATIELENLNGKAIAFDAYNILYQFLSIIRSQDGKPLMDSKGRITSHLSGLFFRTINFIEKGIKPVFVFDGRPPELKRVTVEEREEIRKEAEALYKEYLEKGEIEEARKYAIRSAQLNEEIINSAKKLIELMGNPCIQAPSEGEAQAAYLALKGDVYASASQDMDSLLFGSPRLVRNLSIVGKRRLPGKKAYVEVKPEIIYLDKMLNVLKINRKELIDIGILVGTDYAEGIYGIGPKKALKLIKEYGSIEKVLEIQKASLSIDPSIIRDIFLNPKVTDNYSIEWHEPNYDGIIKFLCDEHDFSIERVQNALDKLKESLLKSKGKTSLDMWIK
ncbi:MAG: flap endonuclease-1 [Nitrososphaerota archaeon]